MPVLKKNQMGIIQSMYIDGVQHSPHSWPVKLQVIVPTKLTDEKNRQQLVENLIGCRGQYSTIKKRHYGFLKRKSSF